METKPPEAEIRDKLARLQELKGELDAFDAQLGDLIPKVETMLGSLRLGIPISLEIGVDQYDNRQYLSFTKVGKQWRLCEEWVGELTESSETTPISDLPRNERANICRWHLPKILDQAVETMEKGIKQRRIAIESTKHLVDTVGKIVSSNEPAAGVFRSEPANTRQAVGMKISVHTPKDILDSIALPEEKQVSVFSGLKKRRIVDGKKRESIADDKKPESIADEGEDE